MALFCLDISATVLKLLSNTPESHSQVILDAPPALIKTAQLQDLHDLSEILTLSFHRPEGLMKWLIPVMRLGIYEDLRQRLTSKTAHYTCLVAVQSDKSEGDAALHMTSGQMGSQSESLHSNTLHSNTLGEPIGTVEVSVRQRSLWQSSSKYVYLSNLAVREDCRRQGIAYHLLQGCEQIAQQWGFGDIYLHVLDNNINANNLYQKLDYQVEQVEGDLFALMFNRPRQVLLRKRIDV